MEERVKKDQDARHTHIHRSGRSPRERETTRDDQNGSTCCADAEPESDAMAVSAVFSRGGEEEGGGDG